MLVSLGWIALGLVLLSIGAEGLVRGASALARLAGITPLVIGLTVVAFGTSAPEMAVSVKAALVGETDVAVGNVVGSNIFNVLGILGPAALILPLAVSRQLLRLDVPIMIGVSVLFYLMARDGLVSRLDGAILFAGILTYTTWLIVQARREGRQAQADDEFEKEYGGKPKGGLGAAMMSLALAVLGLVLLVVGARLLVDGATSLARMFGVSELIIGLTIVAIGTSLPEAATSITAAIKGERDIAVGNVVGSNIFNIMSVLGLSSAISPTGIAVNDWSIRVDIPIMIGIAVICWPAFATGGRVSRGEGAAFVLAYVAYLYVLYLQATGYFAG